MEGLMATATRLAKENETLRRLCPDSQERDGRAGHVHADAPRRPALFSVAPCAAPAV